MAMIKAEDVRRTVSMWFAGATLVICVAGVYFGGAGRGREWGGGGAVSLAGETNACNLWSCTTMSVSQASSSKALKTRLDGIKAADEELRAKEAKLEGALEESRQERREEVARAEELQSRYASLAAKSEGNDKAKKELEEVREDDARQKAKASKFEAKYASLASSFKTSSRELVQGEAKLRTEVEGERKALAEALKRGAVEGRLLAKAEEHARTWETILSAGGVVDWEAKDAKRDRRRQRILEAAEYWAAKREDPYVDEFYKTQVAKDEAYANRTKEWQDGQAKVAEGVEAEAGKAQEALEHERAQREAEWSEKTEAEREKLEGEWAAKEEAREKRYKARMAEWLGMSKKQQEEVEAAWAAAEEKVAGEAEKKKKDWLDSHKEEVSVSAHVASGLASTHSPVAREKHVTKVGKKGFDSNREVASPVLISGTGTAQKSVAVASRPGIASKMDAAAPALTLVKGKGSKNVAAVVAATPVKSSQIR